MWNDIFGSWAWLLLHALYLAVTVPWFFYCWGWGDADFSDDTTEDGDAAVHIGEPDDLWHLRRRLAFRAVVLGGFFPSGFFVGDILRLALLGLIAYFSRRFFRQGVWDADYSKFRRWFGPNAKPLFPNGFRPL